MNDIQDPEASGENRDPEEGWRSAHGNGSWTPPPPPPNWGSGTWRDPGAPYGTPPPYAGQGNFGQANPGQAHPGQPAPPPPGAGPYGYWMPQHGGWGGPPGPGGPGGTGPGGWYGWGPSRPRRSLPSTVTALLLVVAVLVGLGIGHGVWNSDRANTVIPQNPSSGNSGSNGGLGLNPFGGNSGNSGNSGTNGGTNGGPLSGAAATAANGLVDIDTTLSYQDGEAAGTGIVLSSDGYILTNNHVISGATSISATDIANGQKYTATVLGYDRTHDVALIKLQNASGLKTSNLGNSSNLGVGQTVTGLGNAGGVGGTPSSAPGQVTALGQSIKAADESNGTTEELTGLIETDCNIQPGDSGGALVNGSGQVVGMDTAASTGFSFQTQGNQGFAIPINQAVSIANQIRSGKATSGIHIGETAFLGVEVDTSSQAAGTPGAVISSQNGVIPNGPAANAGITAGSVITSLGGTAVDSPTTLTNLIGRYHPGDKVSITWSDASGQTHTATVTLAKGPAA